MWIEEGFRDLKGQGFGLDRHRLRTGASLRGWLWLLALGMALLILLGARLQGREWLPRLLAHPERQSLFRLGRIALAQGPPPWREAVVEELIRLLQELGEESDESDESSGPPPLDVWVFSLHPVYRMQTLGFRRPNQVREAVYRHLKDLLLSGRFSPGRGFPSPFWPRSSASPAPPCGRP